MTTRVRWISSLSLVCGVAATGCTWVSVEEEARAVRVVSMSEVASCESLGKTTSKTADRVVLFARKDRKIREELEALARNEAANMGGDSIVALGAPTGGRQTFGVYRCQAP